MADATFKVKKSVKSGADHFVYAEDETKTLCGLENIELTSSTLVKDMQKADYSELSSIVHMRVCTPCLNAAGRFAIVPPMRGG